MKTSVLDRVAATRMMLLALVGLVAVAAMILLGTKPAEAAFPGTNGKIAFDRGGDIHTMNPDGSGVRRLTDHGYSFDPAFSADGQKITYQRYVSSGFQIYTMNANDGSGQTQITDMSGDSGDPAWSPDGRKIAFAKYNSDTSDIYITNSDGTGEPLRLTYHSDRDRSPAWSPDGTRLAWNRGSDIRIVRVDSSGRAVADHTKLVSGYEPSWSPDGEWIAFKRAGDYSQISVIKADGSEPSRGLTRLYSGVGGFSSPAFSPDGTKIAYRFSGGISDAICIVTSGGADQGCLTGGSPGRDDGPDWQPLNFSSPPARVPFCSVSDCVEPTITNLSPAPESSTRDRTPTIRATVSDRTNLAKADIKLFVDGRSKTTFSYDRSTDRLRYVSGRLAYGWHTVRIEAKDVYNNSATESWRFRVRR